MIHLFVFILSLSSITFEILLARIFSITQWNHLSFMVISIALFGFAASGVVLQLIDASQKFPIQRLSSPQAICWYIILYTISLMVVLLTLNRIPLDYFRLTLESVQVGYLVLSFALAALPFFFAGFVLSAAYASVPHQSGTLYFFSMAGSALGAVFPALLLPYWDEGRLIVFAGMAPLSVVQFAVLMSRRKRSSGNRMSFRGKCALLAAGGGLLGVAVFLISPGGKYLVSVQPSPYKALSQTLHLPDAQVAETLTGLHGRVDHVKSRFVRFAPGLSLKFSGRLPGQSTLFKDGDSPIALYHLNFPEDADFAKYTLAYAGHALNPADESVLVIQQNGGLGIACALAAGKKDITVVEQDPNIAGLVQDHYKISVINQNHRAFLAQTPQRFGIIQIENWGSSLPGSAALNQEHFFTVEAITACLKRLTENGVVVIARKLNLPPADVLRLWAAAFESLRTTGAENPERHLAVLRNWDTVVLTISAKPFTATAPIEDFAHHKNFDLVYIPGIRTDTVNRFNIFDQPYHYTAIRRLSEAYRSGSEKDFFASYPLDIRPQNDQRPFQSSFLKWSRFYEFYKSTGSRFDALFISGEMVAAAVLLEAIAITLVLLVLPRMLAKKHDHAPSLMLSVYFLSIGAGFMLVEIYFIKKFIFLFGNPVISFTVVLSGMLVFSGMGGYFSRNWDLLRLKFGLTALVLALVGLLLGLNRLAPWSLNLPDYGRYLFACLLLLPPGILMGIPFPVGMRLMLQNPYGRANAWALNGCASVLATIIAVQIALGMGLPAILACGGLAYAGALIMVMKFNQGSSNGINFRLALGNG